MSYDVIGDVHGHASKLQALLTTLGYRERNGAYRHSDRTAVFVGDLIDRGPEQIRTVEIARRMVDAGAARVVMGNHELNAIAFATPDRAKPGKFLRRHTPKNLDQHGEFLQQVGEGSALHKSMVEWFKTLPLFLDLGGIRVVHAWWHQPHIDSLRAWLGPAGCITEDFLQSAHDRKAAQFQPTQESLKGLEIDLPDDGQYLDEQGFSRQTTRVRWWDGNARTYRQLAIVPSGQEDGVADTPVLESLPVGFSGDSPVFFGHYWLTGTPAPLGPMVACLDYSVGRDGPLVAYRWEGEKTLHGAGFVVTQ